MKPPNNTLEGTGGCKVVRVWPRHGQRGRPLNSVVTGH
jgi:hypothetical protein